MDQSYAADVCMEPMFWFVDNFTYVIGPVRNNNNQRYIFFFSNYIHYIAVICYCCCMFNWLCSMYSILDWFTTLVESKSNNLYNSSHNRKLVVNEYKLSLLYGCYNTTRISTSGIKINNILPI